MSRIRRWPASAREDEDEAAELPDDPRVDHLVDLELDPAPEVPAGRMPSQGQQPPAGQPAGQAPREADAGAGSVPGAPGEQPPGEEPEFVDRRRGRWTAGGAS